MSTQPMSSPQVCLPPRSHGAEQSKNIIAGQPIKLQVEAQCLFSCVFVSHAKGKQSFPSFGLEEETFAHHYYYFMALKIY